MLDSFVLKTLVYFVFCLSPTKFPCVLCLSRYRVHHNTMSSLDSPPPPRSRVKGQGTQGHDRSARQSLRCWYELSQGPVEKRQRTDRRDAGELEFSNEPRSGRPWLLASKKGRLAAERQQTEPVLHALTLVSQTTTGDWARAYTAVTVRRWFNNLGAAEKARRITLFPEEAPDRLHLQSGGRDEW